MAFLLVLISVLLLAVCVFLARIDENIRSGGGTNIQSLASPPPPSPSSPPSPTVITPSSIASIEHKVVIWIEAQNSGENIGLPNFKSAVENEGVSTTDMDACETTTYDNWNSIPSLDHKCLVGLLLSTLAKENWTLITAHAYGSNTYNTCLLYTSPSPRD